LQQDGTFQIARDENADATLQAQITRIDRLPARSVRGNVLLTTEFSLSMHVKYTLVAPDGTTIGPPAETVGTTSFFTSADVTTNERQARQLAAEDLATRLETQLSEGW